MENELKCPNCGKQAAKLPDVQGFKHLVCVYCSSEIIFINGQPYIRPVVLHRIGEKQEDNDNCNF